MLRITWDRDAQPPLLRLEGELLGPWVEEVRQVGAQHRIKAQLDLARLEFADAAGVRLLRELCQDHWHVVACSPFVTELLQVDPP